MQPLPNQNLSSPNLLEQKRQLSSFFPLFTFLIVLINLTFLGLFVFNFIQNKQIDNLAASIVSLETNLKSKRLLSEGVIAVNRKFEMQKLLQPQQRDYASFIDLVNASTPREVGVTRVTLSSTEGFMLKVGLVSQDALPIAVFMADMLADDSIASVALTTASLSPETGVYTVELEVFPLQ